MYLLWLVCPYLPAVTMFQAQFLPPSWRYRRADTKPFTTDVST